jgi:predicted aspartyl protease
MTKRIKGPLLVFSVLWLAPLCFGLNQNPERPKYPFTLSEGGLIFIEVTVNDTKGNFILDTGAGLHVLSKGFAQKLNARAAGRYTGFRNTGERLDLDLFQIDSISIGQFRDNNAIVAIWEVLDKFRVDGVLSARFFERRPVTLDFNQHELVFENMRGIDQRLRNGRVVPLKIMEDRNKALGLFVDLQVGKSLIVECELDTGFDGLLILDVRLMRSLGIDENSASVIRTETSGNTGFPEIRYRAVVPSISLPGAPGISVTKPEATFKRNLIYDGVVGVGFWLRRKMTIDIPRRRMIVGIR